MEYVKELIFGFVGKAKDLKVEEEKKEDTTDNQTE